MGKRPDRQIHHGDVHLAEWLNEAKVEGETKKIPCIKIYRVYKTKDSHGTWKKVDHYRVRDLEKIKKLISRYENGDFDSSS